MSSHFPFKPTTTRLAVACALHVALLAGAPASEAQELKSDAHKPLPVADLPVPTADSVKGVSADGVLREPGLGPFDFTSQRPTAEDFDVIEQAAKNGPVRVILGLPILFVPEGLLDEPGVEQQRRTIATAQTLVQRNLVANGIEPAILHRYATLPYLVVGMKQDAVEKLRRVEGLASATLDREGSPDLSATTPLIGATTALGRGFGGTGQTVAILDTGVDASHPFLSGAVVNEACFGGCANGSGSQTGPGSGAPLPSVISGSFHGTHVAGIAAGRATPGVSFNGVAPRASIMAVNVFHRVDNFVVNFCGTSPSPCALYWTSDALAGLEHVFLNRNAFSIAAVNMSFGAGSSAADCTGSSYRTVVDNLRSVGIASVAAAGNDGFAAALSEPACVPGVISVGAVNNADVVPQFSNSASFLKLLAPGVSVTSSAPGGGLAMANGTSMAAPHVTGSWALLKQRFPRAGVFTLQRALQQTGKPVLDFGSGITTPRVRVDQAVASPAVFAHDFTRDRVADIAVWRPSTGDWWMMGQPTVQWGVPGDIPVAGDYDGDGVTDLAIWRPATGEWWVRGQATIQWGANGDVPVPADYDGNGTTDIAVWRPSTGQWWVRNQSVTSWGGSGDKPVPADYDGNGTADIAVWRPSTGTWYVRNQSTTQWGQVGDVPVPADYDGNRTADIAVWRPGTGEWFIRNQSTTQWGQVGDIPIPRDTGAGRAELTVWRPSTGEWFTLIRIPFANLPLPTTIWGVAGDVPL